ncbi:MAG: hypothetical protein ACR2H6_06940 [Pyrinomonadaceae bacterium]
MPVLGDAGSRRGVVAASFNPNQMNGLRPVMHYLQCASPTRKNL